MDNFVHKVRSLALRRAQARSEAFFRQPASKHDLNDSGFWEWILDKGSQWRKVVFHEFLDAEVHSNDDLDGLEPSVLRRAAQNFAAGMSNSEPKLFVVEGPRNSRDDLVGVSRWPNIPIVGSYSCDHKLDIEAENIQLTAGRFREVDVHRASTVELRNCWVGNLTIHSAQAVAVSNCRIGKIEFHTPGGEFDVVDSVVLAIELPKKSDRLEMEDGPSVPAFATIDACRLWLPRKDRYFAAVSTQLYREVALTCRKLGNRQVEAIFDAAVMSLERKNEPFWPRLFSNLYMMFSDYGANAGRPVLWFVGVMLLSILSVILFDAVEPTKTEGLVGWTAGLVGEGWWARVQRAVSITLYHMSIIGPVFGAGEALPLVAKTGLAKLFLASVSVFSGLQITLFILALRKKFRIQM